MTPQGYKPDEVYKPGQFHGIVYHLSRVPKWFILGGPNHGDEAQCAVGNWPGIKVIGCEPSNACRLWQMQHDWPTRNGPLFPYALSDCVGTGALHQPADNPKCSSLMEDRAGESVEVPMVTIDWLDKVHGPFEDTLLWLDVEGWELQALLGAQVLFKTQRVMAVNLEILERRPEVTKAIHNFLTSRGLQMVLRWNDLGTHHDRLYVLK